jgi:hypothetical protein
MSLPNYLAKIKSAGIYRFVWDKSVAPIQAADTLRLVVGYSEKGPFNTPVYIDNTADFKTIFGGISKRLERKGIFFHRMALQALSAGPILALNLKKFSQSTPAVGVEGDENYTPEFIGEQVTYFGLDTTDDDITLKHADVEKIYNTNRFWSLDKEVLVNLDTNIKDKYISLASTDSKSTSCSVFIRPFKPTGYDVTVKTWYVSRGEEIPSYLEGCEDMLIENTFAEIYVFRGEFTPAIAKSPELKKYFTVTGDKVTLSAELTNAFDEPVDTLQALAEDECSNFIQVYRGTLLPYFKDNTNTYISLDLVFNLDNSTHKLIMNLNNDLLDDAEPATVKESVTLGTAWDVIATTPYYMKGYTYNTLNKDMSREKWQENILSVLTSYKGIIEALTNNVDVEYHYIVDTFESFVGTGRSLKTELALIAKKKDNCLAILNFPFMSELVSDKTLMTNNTFDIKKIKNGKVTLPSASDGASWCAFYTAITLSDGTVKTYCPSAAVVSNLFMDKYGARQPYSIVAGPNYGLVTADGMVGPDYNFSRNDLDFMEPFGVNCLVYVPRRGTQINSNQTAKQTPVSALSKVHVRELVIYLQDEIAAMLQSYQWEFNTQPLRDTVKAKADKLLENVQQNGGVYAFKNVCDESNNTDDVINNEMLILSTHIEPGMGAGKLVEELTIYRKGGMTSSAV